VAYCLLRKLPLDTAIAQMRNGIQRYNAAHQVPLTQTSGYHETLTVAWLRVLHATMTVYGHAEGADAFFEQHPHLLSKVLLRLFYSRSRIMSWEARTTFVEPDLAPLPTLPCGDPTL
jgi:hypothetical protein